MNVNYNPIFIFPEFDLTKNISSFFKLLIAFQIVSIIVVIIIFYPMEVIFLYNLIIGNYSISEVEQTAIDTFKQTIDNITSATLSCDTNNNLIINNTVNALDINKNIIICSSQIKTLYGLD